MTANAQVELIRSTKLAARVPYAYAAITPKDWRLVFTAGACPLDDAGAIVAIGDVRSQAEQVMLNCGSLYRPLAPTCQTW